MARCSELTDHKNLQTFATTKQLTHRDISEMVRIPLKIQVQDPLPPGQTQPVQYPTTGNQHFSSANISQGKQEKFGPTCPRLFSSPTFICASLPTCHMPAVTKTQDRVHSSRCLRSHLPIQRRSIIDFYERSVVGTSNYTPSQPPTYLPTVVGKPLRRQWLLGLPITIVIVKSTVIVTPTVIVSFQPIRSLEQGGLLEILASSGFLL